MTGTGIRRAGHETCNHKAYQLPCAEYEELLARSAGRCEICATAAAETPKGKLVIDHQYGTAAGLGAVRGLVCVRCNSMLSKVDAGITVAAWNAMTPDERSALVDQLWSDEGGNNDHGGISMLTEGAVWA